jgi:hypothetical protein
MVLSIVFFFSLVAICALFALKNWEEKRGRVLAPRVRAVLDARAVRLGELLEAGQKDLENLPSALAHVSRLALHLGAVGFGHIAHWIGERSHRLADMVSYKHRFERRALRSEFLKKVTETRNGSGLDTGSGSGQNR